MKIAEKIKESIVSKTAEGLALSASAIIIWAGIQLAPVVIPALETSVPQSTLVSLLLASLALNIILVIIFWAFNRKPDLVLKYGIYWDDSKNPHCPSCRIPISGYGDYQSGRGYYCKPCKKIFPLCDASGNDIAPEQVIREL
ncbi:hypothetical protein ABOC32_28620 [Pseudomonas sp. WOUb67]|uniref:hypothetical protein n=1 Tax=Pseudomonas sp. WOUb67 TaxID=3161136 RepID=UPI003CEB4FC1